MSNSGRVMRQAYYVLCAAIIVSILVARQNRNNVCKSFADYYSNRDKNPNCYYNPDNELQAHEIIQRHGYPVEVHHVKTSDGYILTLFRIPHGLKTNVTGRPVFVQHGITLNAGVFLISGKKSLGYLLADAGFDVWLGNFRGTRYSRNHTHLSPKNPDYWNFSIHELGVFDLPSQINHITTLTGQKIIFVGFSMGATAGYIYNSIHPERANASIKLFVGLAPVVYLDRVIAVHILSYIWNLAKRLVDYVTNGEFYPRPPLPKVLHKYVCFPFPIQMHICQLNDMILMGWNYRENDPETLPISMTYNSDAVSTNIISHYVQIAMSGKFWHFDYGEDVNIQRYGNACPPPYDMSRINVDNYLIYSASDKMATEYNVKKLYKILPNERITKKLYKVNGSYTHVDFLSGKNAAAVVYFPLIEFLQQQNQT